MSQQLSRWPALARLAGLPAGLPASLAVARAVWGKVHGQPSDFRWIARSAGLLALAPRLETELGLGSEDQPRDAVCWRALPELHVAVHCYPSRARDAAGRSGFLEKHLLAWPRQPGVPAALGALVLLPQVAELGDEAWWAQRESPSWPDPDHALTLPSQDSALGAVSSEAVEAVIERGIAALKTIPQETLAAFYDDLLTGRRPALLRDLEEPLRPEALAALLLPLEPEQAERLSLAGWVPSARAPLDELARRWDGVIGSTERSTRAGEPSEQAGMMAAALVEGEPEVLAAQRISRGEPQPIAAEPKGDLAERAEAWQESVRRAPPRPRLQLPLSGEPQATSVLKKLFDFARDADRRWLDLRELGLDQQRKEVTRQQLSQLERWAEEAEAFQPPTADKAQWAAKVGLLRRAKRELEGVR